MASFTVVACGFAPAPLAAHPAHRKVLLLPDPTSADFVEQGLALLDTVEPHQPVLLLHAGRREQVRKTRVLRALARTVSVLGVPLPVPPTGLAATATWMATLAERRVPAAVAVVHLERQPAVLPTMVVTTSAAGLELPCVKLRHHAVSWVPGVRFGLAIGLGGSRIALNAAPEIDFGKDQLDRVVQGNPDLAGRIDFSLPPVGETVELPPGDPATSWWGRKQFFEQTLLPQEFLPTLQRLSRERFGRCPECGGVASVSCLFCSAREEVVVV